MVTGTPSINIDVQTKSDSKHLAEEHGLVKTTAYIRKKSGDERSPGAERVARHRAKNKQAGIVSIEVRADLAEAIKAAGSADDLIQLIQAPKSPAEAREERRLADVGRQTELLPTWLRWLLLKL